MISELDRQILAREREYIGSYAKPVWYKNNEDCLCHECGGPKLPGGIYCLGCIWTRSQASDIGAVDKLADCVRISYYAANNNQMCRVMYGYKDDTGSAVFLQAMKYILADALLVHFDCIRKCTGSAPTAWATLPSTINSPRAGKRHPLNQLVKSVLGSRLPEIRLMAIGEKTRRIAPSTFQIS